MNYRMMTPTIEDLRSDFNRIAQLPEGWNHNVHYHSYLLDQMPLHNGRVLEIGCGTGELARKIARRARHVLAVDLSPEMIRLAREGSQGFPHIDYHLGDIMTTPLPDEAFDYVVSVAAFHHLPLINVLSKIRAALKPGGRLIILDVLEAGCVLDHMRSLAAASVSLGLRLWHTGRLRELDYVREVWAAHGKYDSYLTFAQANTLYTKLLPGAQVKRHLLWRYSMVWHKPDHA